MDSEGPFGDGANLSVGFSDVAILIVSLLGFCLLASTIYSLILLKVQSRQEFDKAEEQKLNYDDQLVRADVATLNRAQRRARAQYIMKRQRRIAIAPIDNEEQDAAAQPEQEEHLPHLSRKEREKAAKAAGREERKLFEEQRRQLQLDAQEAAKKEKRERERLEAKRIKEEKELRLQVKEACEKTKLEHYNTFLVSRDDKRRMSVRDFCVYLEQHKVVSIDDLADRFQRPSRQVLERIKELVNTCRLTGVFDGDRFIHISSDEMTRVATFMTKQQQVTIQHVTKSTHTLVH